MSFIQHTSALLQEEITKEILETGQKLDEAIKKHSKQIEALHKKECKDCT